ncbi:MAG: hypothetical protein QM730_04750 [Anaerolineales bacterium]
MMITFTTRQREILKILLDANRPIGSVELAKLLHITPRQVNYSMKGVRVWLREHGQDLNVLPGSGFEVTLTPSQTQSLFQKINVHTDVQIVLSVSQRQQLLALFLLMQTEPVILAQLEQLSHVSRMTILKDLDEIEKWLEFAGYPPHSQAAFWHSGEWAGAQLSAGARKVIVGRDPLQFEPCDAYYPFRWVDLLPQG